MNKLFKRTTAFVLMVCLLAALVVPAMAAPAEPADDGSYVYSMVDAMALTRWNGKETDDPTTFAAANAPIPESNTTAMSMWNEYYENGDLNWSYPQVPGSGGGNKTSGNVVMNISSNSQFLNGALLFKASANENIAWFMLKIKAPEVGTYNLNITHNTANNSGARYTKVQIVPAWDMPAYEDYDAAAHNAKVDAIVAAGNNMLPGVLDCDQDKSATGVVTDMGNIALSDVNAEEYFVIFSMDLSKSDTASSTNNGLRIYLQELKLTPVSTAAGSATYTMTTAATGYASNLIGADLTTNYNNGTANWTVAGTHTGVTNFKLGANLTAGYTVYNVSSGVITQKWIALKLKAPAAGTYELVVNSSTVNGNTDTRTGTPMNAYWIDASKVTASTDLATLMTEENLLGYYEFGRNNKKGSYGLVDVAAEEYILILRAENTVTAPTKWNTDYDHANNFYLASIELNGIAAMVGETVYASIADAAAAAKSGDTIKLLSDYVGSIDLPAGVSVDLNGNDWTVSNYVSTNADEFVTDSVGTGKLTAGNLDLFADNRGKLPLLNDGAYTMSQYTLNADADDYETSPVKPAATRFWFKLDLADAAAYDLIATGESGLTIGVELDWGAAETLYVEFDNGNGAEAFAAEWAAAAKNNADIWLYVDIVGVDNLSSDLIVKPVLNVNGQTSLWTGCLVYEVA